MATFSSCVLDTRFIWRNIFGYGAILWRYYTVPGIPMWKALAIQKHSTEPTGELFQSLNLHGW